MELSVLFLISCVLIARKFEKQKMQVASLAYSVTFIVIFVILLFTVDIDIVTRAWTNIFGAKVYTDIHEALLEATGQAQYGISLIGAVTLAVAIQLAFMVLDAFRVVVNYCFSSKQAIARKFKKAYSRLAQTGRNLYLPKRINLLYCRMLN